MADLLFPGTVLADTYRIEKCIGRGGMGEVYLASHARLAGRYAVKVLLGEIATRPDVFARFRREAEVTSSLRHPNIVGVVDFNLTPEGNPFLVMEFLDGHELADELSTRGALPLPEVVDWIGQASSALAAAHANGIVHRDLKPANLYLVRYAGAVRPVLKVVDFGISKVREATTSLTQDMTVMGTPQYMAPEQALGKVNEIDARTDQFALAAITYEMLAGHAPFRGDSIQALLYQVVQIVPDPLNKIIPAVPEQVAAVVAKAMAKKPADRFPSVADYFTALSHAALGLSPLGADAALRSSGSVVSRTALGATRAMPSSSRTLLLKADTTLGGSAREQANDAGDAFDSRAVTVNRGKWGLFAAGIAVAAIAGSAIFFSRGKGPDPVTEAASAREPVAAVAAPVVQPAPPSKPTADLPSDEVEFSVENPPPDIRVTVDGQIRSLPLKIPKGASVHRLRFEAEGFEPHEISLNASIDRSIRLPLEERAVTHAPKKATRPSHKTTSTKSAPAHGSTPPTKKNEKLIVDDF